MILNNATWWCFGSGTSSRFKNTRSPKTDFDAQFFVETGALKKIGFTNIQTRDNMPGMRHHQPIQMRDQNATTISGKTEYLVPTLQGFACRIQFSSERLNNREIFRSVVMESALVFAQDGLYFLVGSSRDLPSTKSLYPIRVLGR